MKFVFLVLSIVFITACASNEKRQPQQVIGEVGGRALSSPESNLSSVNSLSALEENIEAFRQNLALIPEPNEIKKLNPSTVQEPSIGDYRACFRNGFATQTLIKRQSCANYFTKLAPFVEMGLMKSEQYAALKKLNIEITQQAQFMNQKISEAYPENTNVCMDMRRDMLENLVKAMDHTSLVMVDVEPQFSTPRAAIEFLEKAKTNYGSLEKLMISMPDNREATIRNGMKIMSANRILKDNMLNRSSFEAVKFVTLKRMSPNCGF